MTSLLSDADDEPQPEPAKESVPTFDESGDNLTIDYHGPYLGTKDEFLRDCGIDLSIWEVDRIVCNGWEVTGKKKADGEDRIWKSANRQIKCWLKRRAPKFVQEGIALVMDRWEPRKLPPLQRRPSREGEAFTLELALHDAHFGKLCWDDQVGHNYDLKIASTDFCRAVDDLIARAAPFNVNKIVMPIGSDFFQVNNWMGTTASGTVVDSVDDRFPKVFAAGFDAIEYTIRRCREIADVEFFYLGGNHDRETGWYLSFALAKAFAGDEHVTIDTGVKSRKYYLWGPAMVGFGHGDGIKVDQIPLLMATEAPDLWARATQRHFKKGHLHKKAESRYRAGDTYGGVIVSDSPSLSGTDGWHHHNGFVGNMRAAEGWLWSETEGYAGHFSVNARSN